MREVIEIEVGPVHVSVQVDENSTCFVGDGPGDAGKLPHDVVIVDTINFVSGIGSDDVPALDPSWCRPIQSARLRHEDRLCAEFSSRICPDM